MRDAERYFRDLVRQQLPALHTTAELEADVVAELAAQLEDIYEASKARGATDEQALSEAQRSLPDDADAWEALQREISRSRRAAARGASFGASLTVDSDDVNTGYGTTSGLLRFFPGRAIRVAVRSLYKDAGFTATVIATLAVVIGVNSAVFTIVNSVLLNPLPFPESDRVMFLANQSPNFGLARSIRTSVPSYYDRLENLTVFEELAMFRWTDRAIDTGDNPQRVRGTVGTASLFRVIDVEPLLGRVFTDEENVRGNEQKIVLSYGLWQELFAGNPEAVGTTVRVDGQPFDIIGVMPEGFGIFRLDARFWIPAAYADVQLGDNRRITLDQYQIGRLRPGATREQARAELDALNAANLERFPELRDQRIQSGFYVSVDPLRDIMTRDIQPTLYLLWGGAAFVLLIGLANLANLTLARLEKLRKDISTRIALGARFKDLATLLLSESMLVATAGGIAGLALGFGLIRWLQATGLEQLPRASHISLDAAAIAGTLALALVAGLVIGLTPLAPLLSVNPGEALHGKSRNRTGGVRSRLTRRTLVVVQVCFAFMLLVGSGLLLTSFRNLLSTDPGFDTTNLLTARFDLPVRKYPVFVESAAVAEAALAQIRELPGVTDVGVTGLLPFSGTESMATIWPEGTMNRLDYDNFPAWNYQVSTGYLEALGMPLLRGRTFVDTDNVWMTPETTDEPVMILDRILAERFWPGRDAIGQRVYFGANPTLTPLRHYTVIGVVEPISHNDLSRSTSDRRGAYYILHTQVPPLPTYSLVIRSSQDPTALIAPIRDILRALDADAPVYEVSTMDRLTELSLASRNLTSTLALTFGVTAVLLAAVGIYGVLTYLVSQRRREFGIRLALGSSATSLVRLVLREGLALIGVGLVLGLAGAILLRNVIAEQIFGISALDPWVLTSVGGLIVAIAGMACMVPSLRATRVDPLSVLGEE